MICILQLIGSSMVKQFYFCRLCYYPSRKNPAVAITTTDMAELFSQGWINESLVELCLKYVPLKIMFGKKIYFYTEANLQFEICSYMPIYHKDRHFLRGNGSTCKHRMKHVKLNWHKIVLCVCAGICGMSC